MKEKIWNSVEEAVAQAIAQVAIEVIETGVIIITHKLKALQEKEQQTTER